MKYSSKIATFGIFTVLLIGLDQLTKIWAKNNLRGEEMQSYFYDTFRWEYVENTGAFLSLGADMSPRLSFWVFSVLPLVFLLLLLAFVIRKANELSNLVLAAFMMVIAGGIGNIIDRILYDRHVTDFMNMGIGSLRTGIFNVADMYVMAGMGILLVFYRETKIREN